MRLAFLLCLCLSLSLNACGYHLVGQGESSVILKGVTTASLSNNAGMNGQMLLSELRQRWIQNSSLPTLEEDESGKQHIIMRVENATETFTPVAFDSSGLAIQYRLSVLGVLNMYQENTLIWSSSLVSSSADIFGDASALANNPTSIEAEKETLVEQLREKWAQDSLARLLSGF
ncbi:MAG: hypothetical protein R8M14_05480 [Ghiorsea sp.]